MIKLIQNEHIKIFNKKSNRILFLILGIICLLLALMVKNLLSSSGSDESFLDYVLFSTNFLILMPFFLIILAGSIVSNEFDWGTIKLLLIRPAQRSKVLLSKYITVLLIGIYILLIYLILAFIFGMLLFGFSDITGDFEILNRLPMLYLNRLIEIEVMATLAFSISTVFRSSVFATGTAIFLVLTGRSFVEVLAHFNIEWGKYVLFANTNLSQFMNGNRPLFEGMTLPFSITILSVYILIFLGGAWLTFCKRDVTV
ncbi:ABC transporter permease [Alkalihalobacillus sp. AL-G]|uniref:ABC transporter permease n=1 Tax=Alkalihalobacillus sp. AL-G TaxID=2926399 RepID=UPI00272DAE8B|nr:ABC transporter permease [Alkalihalobacillus sp. AL-G]WLD91609.1 ABC transporter permease [Alkalihalobacillus sp. AL-G]